MKKWANNNPATLLLKQNNLHLEQKPNPFQTPATLGSSPKNFYKEHSLLNTAYEDPKPKKALQQLMEEEKKEFAEIKKLLTNIHKIENSYQSIQPGSGINNRPPPPASDFKAVASHKVPKLKQVAKKKAGKSLKINQNTSAAQFQQQKTPIMKPLVNEPLAMLLSPNFVMPNSKKATGGAITSKSSEFAKSRIIDKQDSAEQYQAYIQQQDQSFSSGQYQARISPQMLKQKKLAQLATHNQVILTQGTPQDNREDNFVFPQIADSRLSQGRIYETPLKFQTEKKIWRKIGPKQPPPGEATVESVMMQWHGIGGESSAHKNYHLRRQMNQTMMAEGERNGFFSKRMVTENFQAVGSRLQDPSQAKRIQQQRIGQGLSPHQSVNNFNLSPQRTKLNDQFPIGSNPLSVEKSHLSSPIKGHARLRASDLSGIKSVHMHSSIVNMSQMSSAMKPSKETLKASLEEMPFVMEDKHEEHNHTSNYLSKHTTRLGFESSNIGPLYNHDSSYNHSPIAQSSIVQNEETLQRGVEEKTLSEGMQGAREDQILLVRNQDKNHASQPEDTTSPGGRLDLLKLKRASIKIQDKSPESDQKRVILSNYSPSGLKPGNLDLTAHLQKAQQNLAMTMLTKTRNQSNSPEATLSKLTYSINLVDDSLKKKKKSPPPALNPVAKIEEYQELTRIMKAIQMGTEANEGAQHTLSKFRQQQSIVNIVEQLNQPKVKKVKNPRQPSPPQQPAHLINNLPFISLKTALQPLNIPGKSKQLQGELPTISSGQVVHSENTPNDAYVKGHNFIFKFDQKQQQTLQSMNQTVQANMKSHDGQSDYLRAVANPSYIFTANQMEGSDVVNVRSQEITSPSFPIPQEERAEIKIKIVDSNTEDKPRKEVVLSKSPKSPQKRSMFDEEPLMDDEEEEKHMQMLQEKYYEMSKQEAFEIETAKLTQSKDQLRHTDTLERTDLQLKESDHHIKIQPTLNPNSQSKSAHSIHDDKEQDGESVSSKLSKSSDQLRPPSQIEKASNKLNSSRAHKSPLKGGPSTTPNAAKSSAQKDILTEITTKKDGGPVGGMGHKAHMSYYNHMRRMNKKANSMGLNSDIYQGTSSAAPQSSQKLGLPAQDPHNKDLDCVFDPRMGKSKRSISRHRTMKQGFPLQHQYQSPVKQQQAQNEPGSLYTIHTQPHQGSPNSQKQISRNLDSKVFNDDLPIEDSPSPQPNPIDRDLLGDNSVSDNSLRLLKRQERRMQSDSKSVGLVDNDQPVRHYRLIKNKEQLDRHQRLFTSMAGRMDLALIKEQTSVSHKSLPESPVKGITLIEVQNSNDENEERIFMNQDLPEMPDDDEEMKLNESESSSEASC